MPPRAILTDIEGTTTSIAFVHLVLFPYARARYASYIAAQGETVAPLLEAIHAEAGTALTPEDCIAHLLAWHDADRKIAPLKTLQGLIWAQGYAEGTLRGHVYPDVAPALEAWQARGITLAVYSSGSVAAQKLLFGHSHAGDLTPLFAAFFDTAIGAKREATSYRAIAAALTLPPEDILFLSDIPEELAAARKAGLAVTLLARDGPPAASPYPPVSPYPVATHFAEILPP